MNRIFASLLFCAIWFCAPVAASAANITIDTVLVGDPGNANDPLTGNLYGGVAYTYRMGTTEVTNTQYAAFLNAKAASDPLELYKTKMSTDARGGIARSGVSGSFTYAVKPDMGNKPVIYVSWYDAIRFANWLHNGQGSGDTETGAYTLLGGTPEPSNGLSITRNSDATWFLPSESEWYKSAYYQPASQGGDADNYWLYATKSNSPPTTAAAIDAVGPTRGDIANPGINVANFSEGADWNGQNGNVTTVGSAGPLSQSFYGTSDQDGNVWEWNESFVPGFYRGIRGGSWFSDLHVLPSSYRQGNNPKTSGEIDRQGFRVATVPEASGFSLAGVALAGLAAVVARRRRR